MAGGDELAAFIPTLDSLPDPRHIVVTAAALHCQRAHATYLHSRGAHDLFTIKGNQPGLRRAGSAALGTGARDDRTQQGHGRAESRSIKVIDLDGAPEADRFRTGPEPSKSSVVVAPAWHTRP